MTGSGTGFYNYPKNHELKWGVYIPSPAGRETQKLKLKSQKYRLKIKSEKFL
jgi:hypothetical protein